MIDQHASLAEKFLKKGFWLYAFTFIVAPMWYVMKILISGEVSVSDLGILYWVISLITLLSAFSDLWVGESLKYFLPGYIEKKQYHLIKSVLAYALILQIFIGLLLCFIFLYGADFIAIHYFKTESAAGVIKVFSLFFLWINIFQIISQFFLAVQNTLYYKLAELTRNIFMLSATFFILFIDMSHIINFSFSWIIGLYIWVIYSVYLFTKKYYIPYLADEKILWSGSLCKKVFSYALVVFLSVQASVILSQIDMQMIIYLLWATQAGYYTTYLSLIMIPFLIIGPVFLLLLPVFSELNAAKNTKQIVSMKHFFTKYFVVLWIFFGLFLLIFAESIAFVLFWEKFLKSGEILKYSSLFLVFNFLLQVNFNILWWIGKVNTKLKITILAICINIILNIILIREIWVYGAALATWIWWLFIWLLSEISLWRKYFRKPDVKFLWKNILFMWVFWYIWYIILTPIITYDSRISSLIFLLWIGLLWVWCFCCINRHEYKLFIDEIKKIRSWKKS